MHCGGIQRSWCAYFSFPFTTACLIILATHLWRLASFLSAHMETPEFYGGGEKFLFSNVLIFLLPFCGKGTSPLSNQSWLHLLAPLTHCAKQREHVWASECVSVQYRHLCVLHPLSASLCQCQTLWCALISCYTFRTIVPVCCELIHVPLTGLSSHFNTPNSTEMWKKTVLSPLI